MDFDYNVTPLRIILSGDLASLVVMPNYASLLFRPIPSAEATPNGLNHEGRLYSQTDVERAENEVDETN